MPSSINGIGTHYWGHTELYSDESYITTEWITVGIPIIPIKSLRVRPIGKGYSDFLIHINNMKYCKSSHP